MSRGLILNLIGAENFPNETLAWMDVRDVANTHILILAFENSSACVRYCLAGKAMHASEVVQILRELYPTLNLPEKCADENLVKLFQLSLERVKSVGINFTSLELSLKDTPEQRKSRRDAIKMPGPGPHLMYAMSSGLALTHLSKGRFTPHHTLTYTLNAFFGPDIGSFSHWLISTIFPASSFLSSLPEAIHHPFYYALILGFPLCVFYSWVSTLLVQRNLLDSVSGVS
ncbi:hypothetical protein COLO4_33480 [Corchorus olitorius]|uniref:Uncharacterized protein n=1 Tax=Corchorus olitorius TaxID=93759 RepID=A0A1R3GT73_9ROSI|nr:hypothetical protein COLO4_33480 [Corchorus olitorius]